MFKVVLSFLLVLLFFGCDSGHESAKAKNYLLSFNPEHTKVEGYIQFEYSNVAAGHTLTLSDFIIKIDGCMVDSAATSFTPDSLLFTQSDTSKKLSIDISLFSMCNAKTLALIATQTDSSVLSGKVISTKTEKTFEYEIISLTSTETTFALITEPKELNVTQNLQSFPITVHVFDANNQPLQEGEVQVIYPDISKERNVGSITPSLSSIKDGSASFTYTAPADLQALLDANISSVEFLFYYQNRNNLSSIAVYFTPEENQSVFQNYSLKLTTDNDSFSMPLNSIKPFSVSLQDENKALEDEKIVELNVSIENALVATLVNAEGSEGTKFVFHTNNVTFNLQTKTKSGLVPIYVDASFLDANNKLRTLHKTFDVVVESGPPTAISISYAGTEQDKEKAKFIEHFVISVTDRYFNPVNTHPQISVGAIIGYAHFDDSKSVAQRIYVADDVATLTPASLDFTGSPYAIDVTKTDIDLANDLLVTFGQGYTYEASGVWEMQSFSAQKIDLLPQQYDGPSVSGLGFTIGHNYRQDRCIFGQEWVGQTTLLTPDGRLGDDGTAVATLSYDYYLVGKDIIFYINAIGHDNAQNSDVKVGEAIKHTLRGNGISISEDVTCSSEDEQIVQCRYYAWTKDTPQPYRNANFTFDKLGRSGKGKILSIFKLPIESCERDGHAYIEYTIQADKNETFSLSPSDPVILDEF